MRPRTRSVSCDVISAVWDDTSTFDLTLIQFWYFAVCGPSASDTPRKRKDPKQPWAWHGADSPSSRFAKGYTNPVAFDGFRSWRYVARYIEIAVHKEAVHVGLQVLGAHKPWLMLIKTKAFTRSRTRKANRNTLPRILSSEERSRWHRAARVHLWWQTESPMHGCISTKFPGFVSSDGFRPGFFDECDCFQMSLLSVVVSFCVPVPAIQSQCCPMVGSSLFRTMDAGKVMMLPCFLSPVVVLLLLLLLVYWSVHHVFTYVSRTFWNSNVCRHFLNPHTEISDVSLNNAWW